MSEYRGEGRRDSVALARFLLSAAAASGIDARWLAREAELPAWAFTAGMDAAAAADGTVTYSFRQQHPDALGTPGDAPPEGRREP